MYKEKERRKILTFLKGKGKRDVDAFCIYQWMERCHFHGWWTLGVSLASSIPPNSLDQHYHKRLDFLLAECRNNLEAFKKEFIEVKNPKSSTSFSIPKFFWTAFTDLGIKLGGRSNTGLSLEYLGTEIVFLEKIDFAGCIFRLFHMNKDELDSWLCSHGFPHLASQIIGIRRSSNTGNTRLRISWQDATNLIPSIFEELREKSPWYTLIKVVTSRSIETWNECLEYLIKTIEGRKGTPLPNESKRYLMSDHFRINFISKLREAGHVDLAEKLSRLNSQYIDVRRRPSVNLDRIKGVIYGLAIGDALGYQTQFMALSKIKSKYGSKGIKDLPEPAPFSSNTRMTIAITEGLVEAGGGDVETLMEHIKSHLITWLHSPENNDALGRISVLGVRNLERGIHWSESGIARSKGCGSAVRSAPIGCFYQRDSEKLREMAHAAGICTHGHPSADAACIGTAYLVKLILDGEQPEDLIDKLIGFTAGISSEFDESISKIKNCLTWSDEEKALSYLGQGLVGQEAVAIALFCFLRHLDEYEATVLRGANTNGNSATIACIAGALSGALVGINGIPTNWVAKIEKNAYLDNLAIRFAEAAGR
ncbi:MAG: ADP-ribosylglycohydrolase family protein [Candidatus Hodarchaeota archaeon]